MIVTPPLEGSDSALAETPYSYRAHEFAPDFYSVSVCSIFCVLFCGKLFVCPFSFLVAIVLLFFYWIQKYFFQTVVSECRITLYNHNIHFQILPVFSINLIEPVNIWKPDETNSRFRLLIFTRQKFENVFSLLPFQVIVFSRWFYASNHKSRYNGNTEWMHRASMYKPLQYSHDNTIIMTSSLSIVRSIMW